MKLYDTLDISISSVWIFYLYEATFQKHLNRSIPVYLSVDPILQSISYHDFLDFGLLLTRKLLNKVFLLAKLKSSLRSFTVATMTWLLLQSICFTYDHVYVLFVVVIIRSFSHSWLITGFETRVTPRMPMTSPQFSMRSCSSIFNFLCSVLHIVVCPSVLFLLTTVLSVLLRFTASDCPFCILNILFDVIEIGIKHSWCIMMGDEVESMVEN